MKKLLIKSFDKIIVLLMGGMGILYTSCEYGAPVSEYGVPYGDYKLNGVVTDKETSNPIQNIQVVQYGDTIYTNTEGKFTFYNDMNNLHLKIEDIDGEENGGDFESQEIEVKFTQADQVEKGEGKWNKGKFVKTQNIKLEKKNNTTDTLYGMPSAPFKP